MLPKKGVLVKNTQCFEKPHPRVKAVTGGNRIIDREGCHLPVPVGPPRAPRVVGIARVGGLCVHGDALLSRQLGDGGGQHGGCSAGRHRASSGR